MGSCASSARVVHEGGAGTASASMAQRRTRDEEGTPSLRVSSLRGQAFFPAPTERPPAAAANAASRRHKMVGQTAVDSILASGGLPPEPSVVVTAADATSLTTLMHTMYAGPAVSQAATASTEFSATDAAALVVAGGAEGSSAISAGEKVSTVEATQKTSNTSYASPDSRVRRASRVEENETV